MSEELIAHSGVLPEELRAKLTAPLPDAAIEPIEGSEYHSIKDVYVYERLNEVFGHGGWKAEPKAIGEQQLGLPEFVMRCDLTAPAYGIHKIGYGGHAASDKGAGDNWQSAFTDAFGKCWKQLGIGAEVWKGEIAKREYPEIDKRQIDAHASRPTHLKVTDLVYFDGIVTEVIENKKFHWLNVAGWTVRVPAVDSDPYLFFMHKRIRFRAKWGKFKKAGEPRFLDVTEILEIKPIEPIKIHEVKE